MLTQERLKELLHYCPETGVFTWIKGKRRGKVAGSIVVKHNGKRYLSISVDNKPYKAHRLAFLYVDGELPAHGVDHEDGNGLNNCFKNIKPATTEENGRNYRLYQTNTSGAAGVYWYTGKKLWSAEIYHDRKRVRLGYFRDKEEAIAVRKEAEKKYGYHENHGTERPL
jgi:hypothetical protein